MNNSYHGSLSGPLTFYNVNIDNIIKTFNKIKEEIFKINNNITRERLIKIEYVNNNNAKISYESLYRIETCINQLETNQKTKLANYLYFLSYINNIDKEVTFDLKDLEIVCNWLQDKSKDEYLKNNLIQQYNKDIKLRDNLIEIQLILKKERKPQTPKRKPQNLIIKIITVNIEKNKDDNQKVNSRNNNNNSRNHDSRNNNGRNSRNRNPGNRIPDKKRQKRRERMLQKKPKKKTKKYTTENIKLRF